MFPALHRTGRPAFPVFAHDVPVLPAADARTEAARAIEAVVMAATEPVPAHNLAELVECSVDLVAAICRELAEQYEHEQRGFVLAEVAGGYRFQTHPDMAPYVEQFVLEGQHVRLSAPALETLAIVAYKQPITRGQISAIRGVNVESTLQTLVQKGYVHEVGRDPGPGLAAFYGTTPHFLERLGLASLADLPSLGDFVPGAHVVEALERGLRADQDPRADQTLLEAADDSGADAAADRSVDVVDAPVGDGPGDDAA
ncbi:MAG: SMC-Scp complex subunit ScpB [Actinobacteria bacterium]|nr:SMC-Scp complex subunit ScpB [Actinomycetota bacterium]